MRVYAPASVTVSGLNATGWDADLVVPAARRITVDHIAETTGAHSIVHDNTLAADHITEVTGGHGIVVGAGVTVKLDHMEDSTAAHGITIDDVARAAKTTDYIEAGALHVTLDLVAANDRIGCKKTLATYYVLSWSLFLDRTGACTGTAYARIRKVSDDSIVATSATTLDVSTIPATTAFTTEFIFPFNAVYVNEAVYFSFEWPDGTGVVFLRAAAADDATKNDAYYWVTATTTWTASATHGCKGAIRGYILEDVTA